MSVLLLMFAEEFLQRWKTVIVSFCFHFVLFCFYTYLWTYFHCSGIVASEQDLRDSEE